MTSMRRSSCLAAWRLAGYEGVVSEGGPEHLEPLALRGEGPVGSESAARSAMLGGSSPAAFQILVLPSCSRIRAWAQSAAARAS